MVIIKSKREIEKIFKTGRKINGPFFLFVARAREDEAEKSCESRFAFAAGKKLGSAPLRNRCKRVMRESVRRLDCVPDGYDFILVAHSKAASASSTDIDNQLKEALKRL